MICVSVIDCSREASGLLHSKELAGWKVRLQGELRIQK
jgi:hypothetical protein